MDKMNAEFRKRCGRKGPQLLARRLGLGAGGLGGNFPLDSRHYLLGNEAVLWGYLQCAREGGFGIGEPSLLFVAETQPKVRVGQTPLERGRGDVRCFEGSDRAVEKIDCF